jgi:hypothetical protein
MPEEFIPWLENPENSRQDEWRRARNLVGDLQGTDPRYALDHAMSVLRMITGPSFSSSENWIEMVPNSWSAHSNPMKRSSHLG